MKKITIRCAGVPEHYNLPWKSALEKGLFDMAGIDLQWTDNGSGTGAMAQGLREDKLDMAVMLTEGAVKDIHQGNPSKICSFFVNSPLVWGVHVANGSQVSLDNFHNGCSFAISRFTSGSHLMAYVYAQRKGLRLEPNNFEVVNDLEGGIKSLKMNENQLFLWEKYTTKPYVDARQVDCIDECPTPWPAFVVVASDRLIQRASEQVQKLISIVQEEAERLKTNPATIQQIVSRFKIQAEDAENWWKKVAWSRIADVDEKTLFDAATTLKELQLIDAIPSMDKLIWNHSPAIEVQFENKIGYDE